MVEASSTHMARGGPTSASPCPSFSGWTPVHVLRMNARAKQLQSVPRSGPATRLPTGVMARWTTVAPAAYLVLF
jgi:hypothetical protein